MFELNYTGEKEQKALKDIFAKTLAELLANDPSVVYLDADLMNSMGTIKLPKAYPDRAIDCGVQEANMVGVAAGLSAVGFKPIAHTFGPFASRRCFDQAFMSVGYAKNNVVLIGSDPGVTAGFNGGTHMPFEDIAMYRVVPQCAIFDVTDSVQLDAFIRLGLNRKGLTYIRTPRKNCVGVYKEGSTFEEGKANVLADGKDIAIIASGIMVAMALKAREELKACGIDAAVIDIVSIKPLDSETVLRYAKQCKAIVTAENANINGGLGAAVCECLSETCPTIVKRVGVNDEYGEVGDEEYLKERFKLTSNEIIKNVKAAIALK